MEQYLYMEFMSKQDRNRRSAKHSQKSSELLPMGPYRFLVLQHSKKNKIIKDMCERDRENKKINSIENVINAPI